MKAKDDIVARVIELVRLRKYRYFIDPYNGESYCNIYFRVRWCWLFKRKVKVYVGDTRMTVRTWNASVTIYDDRCEKLKDMLKEHWDVRETERVVNSIGKVL